MLRRSDLYCATQPGGTTQEPEYNPGSNHRKGPVTCWSRAGVVQISMGKEFLYGDVCPITVAGLKATRHLWRSYGRQKEKVS